MKLTTWILAALFLVAGVGGVGAEAPDSPYKSSLNGYLVNDLGTRTLDSLGALHEILADSMTGTRRYITEGTNVDAGKATLASGGASWKLTWPASYRGRTITITWTGANEHVLRVWNHPFPDSAVVDTVTLAPYYNGPPLKFEDADSVSGDPPGSGTATEYIRVGVE